MDEQQAMTLAEMFGCKLQDMPFTYLGLPMGTTKPRVEHFAPLMNSGKTIDNHLLNDDPS
jgi:hypothetical protein